MVKTYTKNDFVRDMAKRNDPTAYWMGRILGMSLLILLGLGIVAGFKFVLGYLIA